MYKLVPVEATEEMAYAGYRRIEYVFREDNCEPNPDDWKKSYASMFDAAPNPWRPISEAPKDSTHVMLYEPDGLYAVRGFRWGDGWVSFPVGGAVFPTHFIPLEWLGSPEDGQ